MKRSAFGSSKVEEHGDGHGVHASKAEQGTQGSPMVAVVLG
jgi:hypothetical protein